MKLLFLNSLKGLRKKKIQMLGIILMVMLSTGIYVAMQSALDRMEDKYYNYLDEQNVEHISVDYFINYAKDVTVDDMNYLLNNQLANLTEEERPIIEAYKCAIDKECVSLLESNPFDNNSFEYVIDSIFQKYEATEYIKSKKISELQDKYDFEFELDKSKTLKQEDTYVKLLLYDENKTINKSYLVEGNLPTNDKEITMLPKYAKIHNIKIGDNYKIGNIDYKVVGFTYAPDYIYPLVSYSAIMFDEEKNNVIYINKENYNEVSGVEEKSFSIVYNGDIKRKFELAEIAKEKTKVADDDIMKILYADSNITMSVFTVTRLSRISALQLEFSTNRLFADYFLYVLLGIAVFVIAIITKKRIEDEKLQIGVLKSLGYSPFSIAVSYLVYPIIGSLIGGSLGYLIGALANGPLASVYVSYYIIPLADFKIDMKYLTNCLVLPTVLLSTLSYIISLFMLRKKPLYLLREGSNLKINIFSKLANKITSILPFKYRFKYSLAFRSLSKLLIVALTSFFTGMLIVLTLIGMNLMQKLVDKTFEGLKYDYMVYVNAVETEELDSSADYILNFKLPINKILDSKGNEKKIDEDITINMMGIDSDSKYIDVIDEDKNSLKDLIVDENNIVINKNMQKLYDIEIGDTIEFVVNEDTKTMVSYKVTEICEEFMNLTGYVDRLGLSKKIGYDITSYTAMLSIDDKYSNLDTLDNNLVSKIATVINFQDMKENINDSMEKYNASIYIVILFASIMAFVIIAVIANIVVEENKKIISLMKVMGYKNKRISSIVLNIYTPIIIVAYLLSIPVMINLLEKIVAVLADDMEMTIPISLEPSLAILGLVGLLVAYYIAVAMSKRVLNKIPLAISLKRE